MIAAPEQEEEEAHYMGVNEYYPEGHLEKEIPDTEISRRNQQFNSVMGFQSYKRYNLHFLEEDVIIYAIGNKY